MIDEIFDLPIPHKVNERIIKLFRRTVMELC
jgi:hypothetical protein